MNKKKAILKVKRYFSDALRCVHGGVKADCKMETHKTDSHLGVSIIGSMVMVMKRVEGP